MNTTFHIPTSAATFIAAMEGMTRMNQVIVGDHLVPPLYATGAEYKQKHDGAIWRHALDVAEQKWGNCVDFATYRAAELRHSGEDPGAFAWSYQTGPHKWHAVVYRTRGEIPDGAHSLRFPDDPIEDPSIALGMGKYGHGAAGNPMVYDEREAPDATRRVVNAERAKDPREGVIMGNGRGPCAVVGDDPTPEYQQISFDVVKTADGFTGVVRIPVGQGKAVLMATSSSKHPAKAAAKGINLAKLATGNPAVQSLLPPQAQLAAKALQSAPVKKLAGLAKHFL